MTVPGLLFFTMALNLIVADVALIVLLLRALGWAFA